MSDVIEVSWLNDHQRIHFNFGTHSRFLDCPKTRKKQFGERKYFFDKDTIMNHHIRCFDLQKKQLAGYELTKRIWGSFRMEGWRGN